MDFRIIAEGNGDRGEKDLTQWGALGVYKRQRVSTRMNIGRNAVL